MRLGVWIIIVITTLWMGGCSLSTSVSPATESVLIDPGHGGLDGGCVANDGTLEKDINLAVALNLRDMLFVCGVPVAMTRETDASIHSSDAVSVHDKKVSDMQNRLSAYENSSIVIAIHQNHFQVPKYHGTQVFYSKNNPQSALLAQCIQSAVTAQMQPQNNRQIKAATDGIYLMHHTTVPAVLVECGFLSNPEELTHLQSTEYRQRMAWAVMLGYWNYMMET